MLELFPAGFEEVDRGGSTELVAYTDAGGEERLWHAFGGAAGTDVEAGWEDRWRDFHRPVRVGPLWVGPPWEEARDGALAVVIDPGRAFGTGSHPTTRLCLELLLGLDAHGSLLDVGCGSGVVAIAREHLARVGRGRRPAARCRAPRNVGIPRGGASGARALRPGRPARVRRLGGRPSRAPSTLIVSARRHGTLREMANRGSRLRYRRRVRSAVPSFDDGVRRRLTARFGAGVADWFDELPDVLSVLAERWQVEFGSLIPRGSMSVVIRSRTADRRPAVLKVSPDRQRLANEAAALDSWTTVHTPAVFAVDESVGALLIEAIEPGTPLVESTTYPAVESVAELLASLHRDGVSHPRYPPLAHRVEYLFVSSATLYKRHPELAELIPLKLYERGRQLATRLADERVSQTVLLHGDLTPVNILDGGDRRGLAVIDPAPCLGDAAFDAIDLLLWRADDVATVETRAEVLAPAIGADASRLLNWCIAFAGMTALELASTPDTSPDRIEAAVTLAAQAPRG